MTEFTKIIPVSCLQGSGFVLPAEFRDAVVKETGSYTLQTDDNKQWPCTITRKQQGSHVRADITGGWRPFAHAVGLQAGDEIRMKHLGGGVLLVSKTGRTGTPATRTPRAKSAAKTPARKAAKPKTPASGSKAAKSASKTPGTAGGGVAKRRGSSSTTKRRSSAAAAAAAPEIAPEPAGEEGPLPEYVPPPPEAGYMQPIWPTWCAIM